MKKLTIFLVILFTIIVPFNLFAIDKIAAEEVSFSPPRFFIGDLITMQFKIITGEENLNIPIYEDSDKLVVENIDLNHQGDGLYIVTIKFRSYVVGSSYISLDFGDFYVDNIPFFVSSLLNNLGKELRPIHNVELLLGTKLILLLIFLIILIIPPILFFSFVKVINIFDMLRKKVHSPFREFKHSLNRLSKDISINDKDLYFSLLNLFRNYLSEITHKEKYKSATEVELYTLIYSTFNENDADLACDLFIRADLVKFSGLNQDSSVRNDDIALVYKLAKLVYKQGEFNNAIVC